jgi:hypothetical protein
MKSLAAFSNPTKAQSRAYAYLGKTAKLHRSDKRDKKYKIFDPNNERWVHFGQMGYQDYTRHKDKKRRASYLSRSRKIRGDWKRNPYSPNNLAIHILW